jgi:hypothetical protein
MTNLLREFPIESTTLIAINSGLIGWFGKTLFQSIIEKRRYKKELKTFFWKEKISAAKKASEFYLENLNFLSLVKIQFELLETGKIEYSELIDSFEKEVEFQREKLKGFQHYEHHHINIFYDFDNTSSMNLVNKVIRTLQLIQDLISNEKITTEIFDQKIKEYYKILKENYSELFDLQKDYLKAIREDIRNYI